MRNWEKHLDSASRKIEIANYHRQQLANLLMNESQDYSSRPTIPVQASFEGVVTSVVASIDQVMQAINSFGKLGAGAGELFETASPKIIEHVPQFKEWSKQSVGVDLRRLRTRMVHYSYEKTSNGVQAWFVEDTETAYSGSRELMPYSDAACQYGLELMDICNELHSVLKKIQGTSIK